MLLLPRKNIMVDSTKDELAFSVDEKHREKPARREKMATFAEVEEISGIIPNIQ